NGLMVVAPKTGDVVKVQNVYEEPTAIRRILPPGGAPAAGFALASGDLVAQRTGLLAALSSFAGAA
ncbi:MAG TPA: NlpC/P60 family protein, partial [Acidimicrobiia bacterium]|nr:NlpC/P60 family protein [Acidimicrobiia bacterium]